MQLPVFSTIVAVDCAVLQVLATSSLQDPSQVDWRTVLPTIVSNMHDYFISVAAKLEKTHSEVSMCLCPPVPHVLVPSCASCACALLRSHPPNYHFLVSRTASRYAALPGMQLWCCQMSAYSVLSCADSLTAAGAVDVLPHNVWYVQLGCCKGLQTSRTLSCLRWVAAWASCCTQLLC
jgi:hypothetical protein